MVATQIFFIFTPKLGEGFQFDEHIFQMGGLKPPTRLGYFPEISATKILPAIFPYLGPWHRWIGFHPSKPAKQKWSNKSLVGRLVKINPPCEIPRWVVFFFGVLLKIGSPGSLDDFLVDLGYLEGACVYLTSNSMYGSRLTRAVEGGRFGIFFLFFLFGAEKELVEIFPP